MVEKKKHTVLTEQENDEKKLTPQEEVKGRPEAPDYKKAD